MAASQISVPLSHFGVELRRLGRKLPPSLAHAKRPDTVRRILTAAEDIFAERGLAGARIGAIARAARVNKALLYYYFHSKEDLHRFALEMLFGQLRAQVGAALDRPASPTDQLVDYVNGYFDFVAAHPNYPRLVQREIMGGGPSREWIVHEYFRPLHSRLTSMIRAGMARNEFRRVDPQHTVLTLIAMTVFYFAAAPVLAELWQCDPLEPKRVAARRRAVLDFLEHGLFLPSARTR
jgi:AcrR family transcriptional regulator